MKTFYSIFSLLLVVLFLSSSSLSAQTMVAECDGTVRSKAQYPRFELMSESGTNFGWLAADANNTYLTAYNGKLHFDVSNSGVPVTHMTLLQTGDLGIGTQTPEERLHIDNGDIRIDNGDFQIREGKIFMLDNSSKVAVMSTNGGSFTVSTSTPTAPDLYVNETDGNIGMNTNNPTSKLHLKQTTSSQGIRLEHSATANNWGVYCDDFFDFNFAYNDVLKAYILDSDGSYNTASDRRVKNTIETLPSVLDKVNQLRPATYYYNSDKERNQKSMGFIAQEVEAIFPELIHEKGGLKTLTYDDFAILAIKAIQEQQQIIQKQASLIDALDQRLHTLENK